MTDKEKEFSSKELFEAIYDVRDRVTRIEESLKKTERYGDKIDEVDDRSLEALMKSKENEKSIEGLKVNLRWIGGFALTLIVYIVFEYLKNN